MEGIKAAFQANWQLLVMAGGASVLLGAVRDWYWLTGAEGERPAGLGRFIYNAYGHKGYRISMGVIGALLIIFGGFLMWCPQP